MSRAEIVLAFQSDRAKAHQWIDKAPVNTRVTFMGPKRSLDQNAKLWSQLSAVAQQVPWHGIKLSSEDWRFVFLDALKRDMRIVPSLDGQGFVNLGRSTSKLSRAEMQDLITLIDAWGAEHGVIFSKQEDAE